MSISFQGGTSNTAASAATITATYSPTAGNLVVIFVTVGGAVSNMTVVDNTGNAVFAGTTINGSFPNTAGTGYIYAFCGVAIAGATSYTVTWTTSQVSSIVLGEYSGVEAVYLGIPGTSPLYYNTGTSTTASLGALPTLDNGDWVVGGMANNSTAALSAIAVSNIRQNSGTARTAVCCLADSGAVATANTSQTLQATVGSSVAWGCFGLLLRPFAGGRYSTINTTGATAVPSTMNSLVGGTQTMKPINAGSGSGLWASGVVYGNSYKPGQTFP